MLTVDTTSISPSVVEDEPIKQFNARNITEEHDIGRLKITSSVGGRLFVLDSIHSTSSM